MHFNFLKWNGEKLIFKKKNTTGLNEFKPVQDFLLKTLENGYDTYLKKIPEFFIEGFEWENSFGIINSDDLNDFMVKGKTIPPLEIKIENEYSFGELVKGIVKKITR
ncbi:MAG TPA: hypothetical protein VFJ43_01230 [Bacteroidia bacterium]|nr:hypothetical protein [Bacteroidia bacterium]